MRLVVFMFILTGAAISCGRIILTNHFVAFIPGSTTVIVMQCFVLFVVLFVYCVCVWGGGGGGGAGRVLIAMQFN